MIEPGVSHVGAKVLLSWLMELRVGVAPSDPVDGSITMAFGRAYRATVFILLLIATASLTGFGIVFRGDPVPQVIVLTVFGLLWLGLLYGAYDAFCVDLKTLSRGIESKSPLTGERFLAWECLQSTSYASYGNWYTFKSDQGWAIRVSIYRNGLKSFSALVSANIARSPARFTPSGFYAHTA